MKQVSLRPATHSFSFSLMAICAFFVFCLSSFSGCWTSAKEGHLLRRDLDSLKKQMAKATQKAHQDREKLQKILQQA
ncbi:MAG: hypothetical protein V1754_00220, partial [Pseudomonadota bacterium]